MAYDFNMQMNMQAPSGANISRVKKQIEAGLGGINIGGLDAKGFAKANSEIDKTRKNLKKGEQAGKSFFQALTGRAANYATFTAISTAVLKLTGAVSQATREAIKYEAELIKISQVTGDTISRTKEYGKELLNISKTYNVNITKIAQLTRTLTQTGLSFREASKGAELLARTSLLASFDNLTSTTEGLIAVMQTFNLTVTSSAKVLEEINIVSKRFAVESGDIVEAIRRTGGAFSAAGGNVEELIALFTSVRSTSRESAETIATGFRTIFGRLQRPKTIEYFKELGIQLQTAEGQFVGPYEAIKRISEGLDRLGISAGSVQFAQVVEQIGGIRQLSKVVPLLEQFNKSQRALDLQNKASAESTKDIEKAQQGLGFQLGALRQEFGALIAEFVDSSSFKFLAETFISIARTVIRLTASFKPLLPILATLTAFKIGKGLGTLLSGGFSLKGLKDAAVAPKGFARGGIVPGSGNGDTVPAMLTPGEFVVRKSAVQAFGAGNLGKINRYADGGEIIYDRPQRDGIAEDTLNAGMAKAVNDLAKSMNEDSKQVRGTIKNIPQYESVVGILFEAALSRASGGKFSDDDDPLKPFDFPDGLKNSYFNLVGRGSMITDAKKRKSGGANGKTEKNIKSKIARFLSADGRRLQPGKRNFGVALMEQGSDERSTWSLDELGIQGKNTGGSISGAGTDTVPALLTPGEFVVNKKSAQAYGYNNLKSINKYAKGGIVQRFADGGPVDPRAGRISDLLRATDQGDVRGRIDTSDPKAVQDQIKLLKELVKLAKDSRRAYHDDAGANRELFDAAQRANDIARERLAVMEEMADSLAAGGGGGGGGAGGAGGAGPAAAAGGLIVSKKAEAETTELATMKLEDLVDAASKSGYSLIKVEKSGKKAADAQNEAAEAAKKLSLNSAQVVFGFAAFTSSLKNFLGVNLNQEALDAAQVKAGKFGGAADVLNSIDAKKIKTFSRTLYNIGGKLPSKLGKPLQGLAVSAAKNSKAIIASAKTLGKGLNVAMFAELGGGLLDALMSVDYKKQKEAAIESGNADLAAAAAGKQYTQEYLRGIPIIGGFLAAFQEFIPFLDLSNTAMGQLVSATAAAQASMVAYDKTIQRSIKAQQEAAIRGDFEGVRAEAEKQIAASSSFKERAGKLSDRAKGMSASISGEQGAGILAATGAGALTGAYIGSFLGPWGTAAGAAIGAIVGGGTAFYAAMTANSKAIEAAFEVTGEMYEKWGEATSARIKSNGEAMANAATNMIKNGASIETALRITAERYGAAFKEVYGEIEYSSAGLEQAYKNAKKTSDDLQSKIDEETQKLADAKITDADTSDWSWNKTKTKAAVAASEAELKKLEAEKQVSDAARESALQMGIQTRQQEALNKERRIEAERIRAIINLNRGLSKTGRAIRGVLDEFNNVKEIFDLAGTGKVGLNDRLAGTGVSARTLRMESKDILKDETARAEIVQSIDRTAAAQGMGGAAFDFMERSKQERQVIDRFESMFNTGELNLFDILDEAETASGETITTGEKGDPTSKATKIQERLMAQIGDSASETLKAGVATYAKILAETRDPVQAAEQAKQQLSEQELKMIEEQQKYLTELAEQRNTLDEYQLALYAKGIENAVKQRDIQRKFGRELDDLSKSSADFFDVDTTSKGRLAATRRAENFARTAAGKEEVRANEARATFAKAQKDAQTAQTAVPDETAATPDKTAVALENLALAAETAADAVREQIDAEYEVLNTLREKATAERDMIQALRDAQGDLVSEFAFGTDEQRGDLLRSANAAQMAASQGSLSGLSEEMRGQVSSFLDRFSDVSLGQFGGRTGAQVKGDIAAEEAVRAGLISRSQKADFAAKVAKQAVPVDQRMADQIKVQEQKIKDLIEEERSMRLEAFKRDERIQEDYKNAVAAQIKAIDRLIEEMGLKFSANQARSMNIQTDVNTLAAKRDAEQGVLDEKKAKLAEEKATADKLAAEQKGLYGDRGQAEKKINDINEKFRERLIKAGLLEMNSVGDPKRLGDSAGARRGSFKFKQRTLESGPRTKEQEQLIKEYRDAFEAAGKARFDAQQKIDLKQGEMTAQQTKIQEAEVARDAAQTNVDAANNRLKVEQDRLAKHEADVKAKQEAEAAQVEQTMKNLTEIPLDKPVNPKSVMGGGPPLRLDTEPEAQAPALPVSPGVRVAPPIASPAPSVTALTPSVTTPAGGSLVEQIPKFEITGSQQITIAMPDVQAAFSKEITGMVYSAVASVFKTAAEKIDDSTSPKEVALALQDAANNTQTVTVGVS